jgi:hypothetical protein
MIDDMNLNIQAKDLLKKFFKNKRKWISFFFYLYKNVIIKIVFLDVRR